MREVQGEHQEQRGDQRHDQQRHAELRVAVVHLRASLPASGAATFHDRPGAVCADQVFAAHQASLRPAWCPGQFSDVGPSMRVCVLDCPVANRGETRKPSITYPSYRSRVMSL